MINKSAALVGISFAITIIALVLVNRNHRDWHGVGPDLVSDPISTSDTRRAFDAHSARASVTEESMIKSRPTTQPLQSAPAVASELVRNRLNRGILDARRRVATQRELLSMDGADYDKHLQEYLKLCAIEAKYIAALRKMDGDRFTVVQKTSEIKDTPDSLHLAILVHGTGWVVFDFDRNNDPDVFSITRAYDTEMSVAWHHEADQFNLLDFDERKRLIERHDEALRQLQAIASDQKGGNGSSEAERSRVANDKIASIRRNMLPRGVRILRKELKLAPVR